MDENISLTVLKSKLHYQLQLARKQAEAVDLVIRFRDDLEPVQAEVQQRREKRNLSSNMEALDFNEEIEDLYLKQLQECLDLVQLEVHKRGHYSEQIVGILSRRGVPFDAMGDAYQFILESNFDIDLLMKEIHELEDSIANPPKALLSARDPKSTPSIYKRTYLMTLKDISKRIKDIKRGEK